MNARGVLVVIALASSPAAADLRIGFRNDAFTEPPPVDDSGFTNDVDVQFWRPHRAYVLGGAFLHRWLTEVGGDRRTDLMYLVATGERTWPLATTEPWAVTVGARLGPTFTGNLGGRWLQNGWHELTGTGPTLDEGLQHHYVGGFDAGVLVGGFGRATWGDDVQGYAQFDAQGALGTGVSSLEALLGGSAQARLGRLRLGASVEGSVARYHVAEDALAMPGGYGTGWQLAWRAGFHVAWSRFRFEYQYRANEGGSGEPIGVIAFTIKQAGTSY